MEHAIFAGGCFWGIQDLIRSKKGVLSTRVGYCGGHTENPTYNDVKWGTTGHAEAIEIAFDNSMINYRELLELFFQIHDPTTPNQQGNDKGTQYRSAIFYTNESQKEEAENMIKRLNLAAIWPNKIVTQVTHAPQFWQAEDYHQDYLVKNPNGYTCHFIRPGWKLPES